MNGGILFIKQNKQSAQLCCKYDNPIKYGVSSFRLYKGRILRKIN